jgi:uncharacterized protein YciI
MKAKASLLVAVVFLTASAVRAQEPANRNPTPMPPIRRPPDVPKNMQPYFVALLVKGPKPVEPNTPEHKKVFGGHLAHIRAMIEQGHYVLCGPFTDDGRVAGMCIVTAPSVEAARQFVVADPAVQAGVFEAEVHPAMLPSLGSVTVQY